MVTYKTRRSRAGARAGRIAATEAAKNFGRLVDRVREEGVTYVVERGGMPVAQIGPVGPPATTLADLIAFFRDGSRAGEPYLRAVESGIRRSNKPAVPANPWER